MKEITVTLRKKGYKILSQLGNNHLGGRITYKAVHSKSKRLVVIKYFQLLGALNWSGYNAIEREIETLKVLNHPNIPKYLNSLKCDGDLIIVTEYIDAPYTAGQSFTLDEVQKIAIALLEILIYLHSQNPPIIHRDIKPENILVDKDLNVYLVDFGLAKATRGETSSSSTTVAGTLGFMAPELMQGKSCPASDLYALGITMICWLFDINSALINDYINPDFSINFKQLPRSGVPKIILNAIKKLTEPNLNRRVGSAGDALKLLSPGQDFNKFFLFEQPEQSFPKILALSIVLSITAIVIGVGQLSHSPVLTVFESEKNHIGIAPSPVRTSPPNIQPERSHPIISNESSTDGFFSLLFYLTVNLFIFFAFTATAYIAYQVIVERHSVFEFLLVIIAVFAGLGAVIVLILIV
ncbi:MAG: serine/threonine protein kinase [Hydrococcus sp. RU_2_2]|nr:serine/threonine protein kinase [Hydrococcus sp. RU_2_2]NJP19776.1 serine/threonine protein kinase [Hydrococcus sp. CRU_1_1]